MTGKGGGFHVPFDDVIGFLESLFDVSVNDIGKGDIPLFGGIVAAASSSKTAEASRLACRGGGTDDGSVRLASFKQVYDKRQHFPFHLKSAQTLFADVFIFRDDDDADFHAFMVGIIA